VTLTRYSERKPLDGAVGGSEVRAPAWRCHPGGRRRVARYALLSYADGMTLHIFQSAKKPEMYGFTNDPTGSNLPSKDGPWEGAGSAIPLGTTTASTSPEISQKIEINGFALVEGHSISPPPLLRKSTP
jgi:hypothetical protein